MASSTTPTSSPVLELRHLSRTYGTGETEVHALSDVNVAVVRGEMVAVMGPSGSGKSTLLTIAGTLERPSDGEVWIDGNEVSTLSRNDTARLRRRTIGYVFQDFNLLAGLTALENVSLPLELDGVATTSARQEAEASLALIGLEGRGAHFPDQLSGGERQRVAIARAVVGGRHLLFADEPSGALDQANAEAVMGMIRDACHAGVAAVVVTHDAHLAAMADRVIHLLDGRVTDVSGTSAPSTAPAR
jgi:putative ABC transport system ATP-binding protein